MKKKKILLVLAALVVLFSLEWVRDLTIYSAGDVLEEAEGTLYYTRRIDGVSTLFAYNPERGEERLVYSHQGKGLDAYGSFNDNILDHRYDLETGVHHFVAMTEGEWTEFALEPGKADPEPLGKAAYSKIHYAMLDKTDYLKLSAGGRTVSERKGSLYLLENGEEICVRRFWGLYDEKFTGCWPLGLSPDGRYLFYRSMGHMTFAGTMLEGMLTGDAGRTFVRDLESGRTARFPEASRIQWVDAKE